MLIFAMFLFQDLYFVALI